MMSVLAETDMVAMLSERLVEVPGYEMAILWRERRHRDAGNRWVREWIAGSL